MINPKSLLVCATLSLTAGAIYAQEGRFRHHDETIGGPITQLPAINDPGETDISITVNNRTRQITGNGIPGHLVGSFPNHGNPHAIREQEINLTVPATPELAKSITPLNFGWNFGVSLRGVVFDPLAAEFWHGDPRSGWSYNALGGAIHLGLDANHAHVQPTGTYHYHGLPLGLMELEGWSSDSHSPLVGYAADGFPIYALTGVVEGALTPVQTSYRLKAGDRPGGDQPDGAHDGTFVEDYEYVEGLGHLDECNGARTVSAEYPAGTYAYFLTADYPAIPRCFKGTPDPSFRLHRAR